MTDATTPATPNQPKDYKIDFIDPLFAVALHIGLVEGLMHENWFRETRMPAGDEEYQAWGFFLSLLTVVLSWMGYHESIKTKPLRGWGRFLVDVVLVLLYAVLLVKYHHLSTLLPLLVVVYMLFVLWDILKVMEYWPDYKQESRIATRFQGKIVTVIWFVFFLLILMVNSYGICGKGISIFLAYISTLLYRIHKKLPILQYIFGGAVGSANL